MGKSNLSTWDLYRAHPGRWADLPYRDALAYRMELARAASAFYRLEARGITELFSAKRDKLLVKYNNSNKAINWNEKFLNELPKKKPL